MQHEIKNAGPLLKEDGMLREEGYATRPILEYNRNNIKHGWHRIKEWDYYAILAEDYGIAFTVADLGLFGLINVVWLDFKSRTFTSLDDMQLLTRGRWDLPTTSEKGDIHIKRKKMAISVKREPDRRIIHIEAPEFVIKRDKDDNGAGLVELKGLTADFILIQPPEMDTMVIATSWKEKRTAFYYNQKINCMETSGMVNIGGIKYEFGKHNNSYIDA